MKRGRTGARLLLFAFCTLIVLFGAKLGLTVIGALHTVPGSSVANLLTTLVPQPVAAATSVWTDMGGQSMSALEQEANKIHQQQRQFQKEQKQLEILKKQVERKTNTLLVLQKRVMLAQARQKTALNSKTRRLARIYGAMKPGQAAKLMGSLNDSLVKAIISTLPPDKAASILASMNVKKAVQITVALSGIQAQ